VRGAKAAAVFAAVVVLASCTNGSPAKSKATGSAHVAPPDAYLTTARACTTVVTEVPNGGAPAAGKDTSAARLPALTLPCLT